MADSNDSKQGERGPSPNEFTEDEIARLTEFLTSKGGVVLLESLQDGPKRFVTLREELRVSPITVQDRIEDAKDLDLVSKNADYSGGNGYKRHPLTAKGQVLADELRLTDLARIRKEIWKLEDEFEDQVEEFQQSLEERTTELNDEFATQLHNQL